MVTKPVVQYTYDPQGLFQQALKDAAKKVSDLTIPFTLMTKEWYQGNKSIFSLKGPGKYPPLGGMHPDAIGKGSRSHREIAEARKRSMYGFDYPLLLGSGRLMSSITGPGPDSINNIINKRELDLGTRVEYGIYHQSSSARKTLPFRPFLFIGPEQQATPEIKNNRQTAWIKILESYVKQVWDGE